MAVTTPAEALLTKVELLDISSLIDRVASWLGPG